MSPSSRETAARRTCACLRIAASTAPLASAASRAAAQLHQNAGANLLVQEACKLNNRLDILSSWLVNLFVLLSVLILVYIATQAYSGRLNWKHLAVLGGSVAMLALSHLVPAFFFDADCRNMFDVQIVQ